MDIFWQKLGWEQRDRHFLALKNAPFQRDLPPVELTPGVTLIRGPRQIGKSTWLKTLLKRHVDRKDSCFYYTCEDLKDFQDLAELMKSQKGTRYFFLDEVTFVEEWWRAVKKAVDVDASLTVVLTGSNSYDLKKGMDLMPGRWAKGGGELFLLPMLFDEWCLMRERAGWPSLDPVEALRGYMRVGGFPTALAEAGPTMAAPVEARRTYLRWLMGDVLKLNRQEIFMRELMGQLVKIMGNSVSLQSLAQKTQLMSYHTAQDYLSILEHAFAHRTVYA